MCSGSFHCRNAAPALKRIVSNEPGERIGLRKCLPRYRSGHPGIMFSYRSYSTFVYGYDCALIDSPHSATASKPEIRNHRDALGVLYVSR